MEIFEGKTKNLFFKGFGTKKRKKNQKYTKTRELSTF